MYPISRFIRHLAAPVALAALLACGARAGDEPAAPQPAPTQPTSAAPAAPAAAPAEKTSPAAAPATQPPAAAPAAQPATSQMRDLTATEETERAEKPEQPEIPEQAERPEKPEKPERAERNVHRDEVSQFSDAIVPADSIRNQAVAVAGNLTVDGEVLHDAVAIGGVNLVRGSVGHDTVVVGGTSIITGKTGHDAVAVFSDVYLNGSVGHDLVVVFGDVHLGPKAHIGGQKVIVVGRQIYSDGKEMDRFLSANFKATFPSLGGIGKWVRECLLKGRLLAFQSGIGFAWTFAAANLFLYFLIALLFPKGVERCVTTVEESPGMSLVAFFLTLLLLPFVLVILAITGIGAIIDVILLASLFIAMRFGRAVMHAWAGRFVTRYLPKGPLTHVAFSVLIGGVLIALLYCTPFIGLMVNTVIGFFGLGAVVLTIVQKMSRDRKAAAAATPGAVPPVPPPPVSPTPAPSAPLAAVAEPVVSTAPASAAPSEPAVPAAPSEPAVTLAAPPPPMLPPPAPVPPKTDTTAAERLAALSYPRATFFQRMGALLIDVVLIAVVAAVLLPHFLFPGSGPGRLLLCMATYGAIFWQLKGTTIGGVILRLQVVRADGRPLDWTTSIVRGLGCLLSAVFAGLGFFWIAIDPNREAWHDKIAGTIVVRTPTQRPLV
ncbi:RDD family protein [mine drainage metagenome]|uniref:RDD family protein n=1 Tax=mine drainage metagenome TaxID=410659 RepID=A0A1J5SQK4_9ZZZZ